MISQLAEEVQERLLVVACVRELEGRAWLKGVHGRLGVFEAELLEGAFDRDAACEDDLVVPPLYAHPEDIRKWS